MEFVEGDRFDKEWNTIVPASEFFAEQYESYFFLSLVQDRKSVHCWNASLHLSGNDKTIIL